MAYDSRTDRNRITWEKKTERSRKYRESDNGRVSRQQVKNNLRREFA